MLLVLSVFKIIGIVLIVLAAVAAAVLFCPVRYEFDLDIDRRLVSFRVSWLLHLLRFRFRYEEKMQLVLSVLFFRIDFTDEERKEKRQKKKEARASARASKKHRRSAKEDDASSKKKRPGYVRFAVHVLSLVRQYEILETIVPGLRIFLFRIRPRKLKGRIEFGMEDPSVTGRMIGGLSLIPVFYQTDFRVTPDFETEESYVRGTAYASGHMLVIHAVLFLVGVLRQKNIRQFIGALRRKK